MGKACEEDAQGEPAMPNVVEAAMESGVRTVSRKGILEAVASFGLLAAVGSPSVASAESSGGIVGAWSLVSFDLDDGKSEGKPRFGPAPVGYLIKRPQRIAA
jgi:hypothetical protein